MGTNLMSLAHSGDKFMKLYGDRKMVRPLPYLRRVAYLESHGTEWIDTGINYDGLFDFVGFEYGFKRVASILGEQDIFGKGAGNTPTSGFDSTYGQCLFFWAFSSTRWDVPFDFEQLNKVYISYSRRNVRTLYLNDSLVGENYSSVGFDGDADSVYMFASSPNRFPLKSTQVFFGKIVIDNIIVRDFLPVLDLSGRPAMYDEVSGQLFYNQGTGEFTWGELDAQTI